MKLVILCCVLSLVVLNGCVRLSGAAGCWKTTSEGETTSKEVGFDTADYIPSSPAPGSITT